MEILSRREEQVMVALWDCGAVPRRGRCGWIGPLCPIGGAVGGLWRCGIEALCPAGGAVGGLGRCVP